MPNDSLPFPPAPVVIEGGTLPPNPIAVNSSVVSSLYASHSSESLATIDLANPESGEARANALAPLLKQGDKNPSDSRSPISTGAIGLGIFERLHDHFKQQDVFGYERANYEYKSFVKHEIQQKNATEFTCERNRDGTPKVTLENGNHFITYKLDDDIIKYQVKSKNNLTLLAVDTSGVKQHNVITAPISHQEFGYECKYFEKGTLAKSFSSADRIISDISTHKSFAKELNKQKNAPAAKPGRTP